MWVHLIFQALSGTESNCVNFLKMNLWCILHIIAGFILGVFTALVIVVIDDARVVSTISDSSSSSAPPPPSKHD